MERLYWRDRFSDDTSTIIEIAMIKSIRVDNFRCMVNFEIEVHPFQLWLGANGTGKTSVLDILRVVKRIVSGELIEDIFASDDSTVWDNRDITTIEISAIIDDETYDYRIEIEDKRPHIGCRIKKEMFTWKGNTFYLFDGQDSHLFRINNKTKSIEEGACFSADWSRSLISTVGERNDNEPLLNFRKEVAKWLVIKPIPLTDTLQSISKKEERELCHNVSNFASWYRHIVQENPGITASASELLKKALPDFVELSLPQMGDARVLKATFRTKNKSYSVDFDSLSDGQRQLIILYVILESLRSGSGSVLFIDEPDNFVSLREIGPWLAEAQDICEDKDKQIIIVSHHPKPINELTHGNEIWFSRPHGELVQVGPYPVIEGYTPAETMERGAEQ